MTKTELPAITQNERRQIIQSPMLDYCHMILQMVPNHLINEVVNHFITHNAVTMSLNGCVAFGGFYLPIEEKTCLIAYDSSKLKFQYMVVDMMVDMFDLDGEYEVNDVQKYPLDIKIQDLRFDSLSQVMLNQLRQIMIDAQIMNEDATLGMMLQRQMLREMHLELN